MGAVGNLGIPMSLRLTGPRKPPDRGEKAAKALRTYTHEEVRSALVLREVAILILRAGAAETVKPMTLREIGELFGVNSERVRVLVNESIVKLRTFREGVELEARQATNQDRALKGGVELPDPPDRITVGSSARNLYELRRVLQWEERQW